MSAATQKSAMKSRVGTPTRSRNLYRVRSFSSDVDETLFGSPSRFTAQKDTPRINPEDVTWDPPWVTSPKENGAPLLWTPFDSKDSTAKNIKTSPRTSTTPRNKYRLKKQVPSYVDETLFGTPRKTKQSKAPWATDNNSSPTVHQVTWSPPLEAPDVNMSIESRKIESKADTEGSDMHYTPVIKARPGSTLNTPSSQGRFRQRRTENGGQGVSQKLDFCIENGANDGSSAEHDPDAIIARALKLAGISRDNHPPRHRSNSLDGLSSRASTPGRYFWRRPVSPSSTISRPGSRMSGKSFTRAPRKTELKADDIFSATGTQLPLSARDNMKRPNSARTNDSVPGLDLTKPPRLYGGVRTPRSARSAGSRESSIANRPSWRP